MFSSPSDRHFCTTLITSSCTHRFVLVIVKLRRFYIQVRVNQVVLSCPSALTHSLSILFVLTDEGNQALQEFLQSKNPRQEHSSTLESYLIKPIQRILKYPLLLLQLKNLTDPYCDEHMHLVEALKGMEKVAEHINEMQRIHEEYGAIFDHLFRQHQKSCKQPIDMSPGEQPGEDPPTTRIDGCDVWQKNMQNSFFVISHPFWLSSTHFSALFLSLYLPSSSHDMNSWKLWTNLKIQSLV